MWQNIRNSQVSMAKDMKRIANVLNSRSPGVSERRAASALMNMLGTPRSNRSKTATSTSKSSPGVSERRTPRSMSAMNGSPMNETREAQEAEQQDPYLTAFLQFNDGGVDYLENLNDENNASNRRNQYDSMVYQKVAAALNDKSGNVEGHRALIVAAAEQSIDDWNEFQNDEEAMAPDVQKGLQEIVELCKDVRQLGLKNRMHANVKKLYNAQIEDRLQRLWGVFVADKLTRRKHGESPRSANALARAFLKEVGSVAKQNLKNRQNSCQNVMLQLGITRALEQDAVIGQRVLEMLDDILKQEQEEEDTKRRANEAKEAEKAKRKAEANRAKQEKALKAAEEKARKKAEANRIKQEKALKAAEEKARKKAEANRIKQEKALKAAEEKAMKKTEANRIKQEKALKAAEEKAEANRIKQEKAKKIRERPDSSISKPRNHEAIFQKLVNTYNLKTVESMSKRIKKMHPELFIAKSKNGRHMVVTKNEFNAGIPLNFRTYKNFHENLVPKSKGKVVTLRHLKAKTSPNSQPMLMFDMQI